MHVQMWLLLFSIARRKTIFTPLTHDARISKVPAVGSMTYNRNYFGPRGYPTAELIDMHLNYSINGRFFNISSLTELPFVNLSLSKGFQGL